MIILFRGIVGRLEPLAGFFIFMEEIWSLIKGFEYEVSNKGQTRSVYKEIINSLGRKYKYYPVLLKQSIVDGYCKISMSIIQKDGKRKQKLYSVHRLVAMAFLENPIRYDHVNHKDGNKLNNCVENLEWCTHSENMRHAYKTGLNKGPRGEKQGNSLLTEEIVLQIREMSKTMTRKQISSKLNLGYFHIRDIQIRKSWKHI